MLLLHKGWTDGRTDGRRAGQTDGRTDGRTAERTERMDRQMDGWKNRDAENFYNRPICITKAARVCK